MAAARSAPVVAHQASYDLPLVDFSLVLRDGALADPRGREGLASLMMRTLRRGRRRQSQQVLNAAIAELGARLSARAGRSWLRIDATILARNLDPLLSLMAGLLFDPGFRRSDLAQLKRMAKASLMSIRDDDHLLAARHLRTACLNGHPYGRMVSGQPRTIASVDVDDLRRRWRQVFTVDNMLVGLAGPVSRRELSTLLTEHFGQLSRRRYRVKPLAPTRLPAGRRVRIVHKPGRHQNQIAIATLGAKARDRDLAALMVADAAFGGMFTSTLSHEVRVRRGWSYSVSSSLGFSQERDLWQMWSHPSTERAVDCLQLQLDLLERWVDRGSSASDIRRAKKYLIASRCFDVDTAAKRLELDIETWVYGLPSSHHRRFEQRVGSVSPQQAKEAVARRISARDLQIVVVGDAAKLEKPLSKLDGVTSVEVVPFTTSI